MRENPLGGGDDWKPSTVLRTKTDRIDYPTPYAPFRHSSVPLVNHRTQKINPMKKVGNVIALWLINYNYLQYDQTIMKKNSFRLFNIAICYASSFCMKESARIRDNAREHAIRHRVSVNATRGRLETNPPS